MKVIKKNTTTLQFDRLPSPLLLSIGNTSSDPFSPRKISSALFFCTIHLPSLLRHEILTSPSRGSWSKSTAGENPEDIEASRNVLVSACEPDEMLDDAVKSGSSARHSPLCSLSRTKSTTASAHVQL